MLRNELDPDGSLLNFGGCLVCVGGLAAVLVLIWSCVGTTFFDSPDPVAKLEDRIRVLERRRQDIEDRGDGSTKDSKLISDELARTRWKLRVLRGEETERVDKYSGPHVDHPPAEDAPVNDEVPSPK